MFVIDNETKQIKLAPGRTLDFEGTKTYEIWVVASDGNGGNKHSATLHDQRHERERRSS
jgi:hypothetical protein